MTTKTPVASYTRELLGGEVSISVYHSHGAPDHSCYYARASHLIQATGMGPYFTSAHGSSPEDVMYRWDSLMGNMAKQPGAELRPMS